MKFTAVINKEGKLYVAWCPELDIASQGKDVEEALANLKEAIELYLEDEDAELPENAPLLTTIEVGDVKAARGIGT
ncbi:type II toxin-antitoxin system HicB family antitoxin [Archaeoglobales archaeon]|nr:MAG: type II toxin-antitoxin system HicB family antitoxin [Archaeoglobales archaeon]